MNIESCDMVRQSSYDGVVDGPNGSFFIQTYSNGQKAMYFKLPNGGDGVINLRPVISPNEEHPSWEWDGNEDKPTLYPSVHQVGVWHGWFQNGRMVSC